MRLVLHRTLSLLISIFLLFLFCLSAQAQDPSIITGPERLARGERGVFSINLENDGAVPVCDMLVVVNIGPSLRYINSTEGGIFNGANNTIRWEISRIEPHETWSANFALEAIEVSYISYISSSVRYSGCVSGNAGPVVSDAGPIQILSTGFIPEDAVCINGTAEQEIFCEGDTNGYSFEIFISDYLQCENCSIIGSSVNWGCNIGTITLPGPATRAVWRPPASITNCMAQGRINVSWHTSGTPCPDNDPPRPAGTPHIAYFEVEVYKVADSASFSVSDTTICEDDNVSLSYTGEDCPHYEYSWSASGGSFSSPNSPNTTWSPPNISSCSSSFNVTLTVTSVLPGGAVCATTSSTRSITVQKEPDSFSIQGNPGTICENETASLSIPSSNVCSHFSYSWIDFGAGGSFLPNSSVEDPTYRPPNISQCERDIDIRASVSGCGETETDTITLTIQNTPGSISITGVEDICENETLSLSINGQACDHYSYSWSDNGAGGSFSPNASAAEPTYNPPNITACERIVRISVTVSGCGDSDSDTVPFSVYKVPSSFSIIGNPGTLCENDTVDLSIPAGNQCDHFSYSWTDFGAGGSFLPNASVEDPTYRPPNISQCERDIDIRATVSGCGESESDRITITIQNTPGSVSITGASDICENDTLSLGLNQSCDHYSYSWSDNGAGGDFLPNASVEDPTYRPPNISQCDRDITISVDVSGCGDTESDSVTITVEKIPDASVSITGIEDICENETLSLDLTDTCPHYSYSWSDGGAGGTFLPNNSVASPTYQPNISSCSRTITITADVSACGVTRSPSDTFTVLKVPDSSISITGASDICENQTLSLSLTDICPHYSYQWSDGGAGGSFGPNANVSSPSYQPPDISACSVDVTLSVSVTACGATRTAQQTISILKLMDSGITITGVSDICDNNTLSLGITDSCDHYTLSWSDNGVGGTFSPSDSDLNPTYTPPVLSACSQVIRISLDVSACGETQTNEQTFTLYKSPQSFTIEADAETICENETVSVSIPASNQCDHFTYQWSDGGAGGSFTPNATSTSVTYSPPDITACSVQISLQATVTGCDESVSSTHTLTVLKVASEPISITVPSEICENNSITLALSDNCDHFTVSWSDGGAGGSFTPNASVLNPSYQPPDISACSMDITLSVSVTGCGESQGASSTVTVLKVPDDTITFSGAEDICENQTLSLSVSETCDHYTYQWSDGGAGGTFSPSDTVSNPTYQPDITNCSQSVTISLSVTGCSVTRTPSSTIDILKAPDADVSITGASDICENQTLSLGLTDTCPHYTYSWLDGGAGGSFTPNATVENPTYTPPDISACSVDINLSVSVSGCNVTRTPQQTINVVRLMNPGITITGISNLCDNETLDLSLTDSCDHFTVSWSDNGAGGTFSPSASAVSPTYTPPVLSVCSQDITISMSVSACGETQTGQQTFTVIKSPDPFTIETNDDIICENATASLSIPASSQCDHYTYQWSDGGAGGSFSPGSTSTSVTYTPPDISACSSDIVISASVTACNVTRVNQHTLTVLKVPDPTLSITSSSQICENETLLLTLSETCSHYTYQWSDGGAGGSFSPSDTVSNPTYTPPEISSCEQIITISALVTGCGESQSPTQTVTVLKTPDPDIFFIGASDICENQTLSLSVSETCDHYTYQWSDGGLGGTFSPSASVASPTYTPPDITECTLDITLSVDITGCSVTRSPSSTITVQEAPDLNMAIVGASDICEDQILSLSLTETCDHYTYQWSDGGAGGTFTPSATVEDPTYTPTDITDCTLDITLSVSVTGCGETRTPSTTITVQKLPDQSNSITGIDNVCENGTLSLGLSETCDHYSYQWSDNGAGGTFSPNATVPSPSYTSPEISSCSLDITISVTVSGCGTSTEITASFSVYDIPVVTVIAPDEICSGSSTELSASIVYGCPLDNLVYTWFDDCGGIFNDASSPAPVWMPYSEGPCTVSLFVTNTETGCASETAQFTVTVHPLPVCSIQGVSGRLADHQTLSLSTDVTTGTPPYTYAWSDDCAGSFDDPSSPTPVWTPPIVKGSTLCTLTLDVTDSNGCTSSCQAEVEIYPVTINVSKQVSKSQVEIGEKFTYTLTVSNPSSNDVALTQITVNDMLPSGFVYLNEASVDGALREPDSLSGQTVTWNNVAPSNGLSPGSSVVVSFSVLATQEGSFTNSAVVKGIPADWPPGRDWPQNDDDEPTSVVPSSIRIEKSASPSSVSVGGVATWTITITNTSASIFETIRVTDNLPSALVYNDSATVGGSPLEPDSVSGGQLIWSNVAPSGGLQSGDFLTVTFKVIATEVGTFTNTVSVEGVPADWPADQPAPVTDSTTATLEVTSSTIKIEKSSSPSSVPVGAVATWTITITNTSAEACETVKVVDTLPDGLTYNNNATVRGASQEPDSISGSQLTWNNVAPSGGLQPGDSVTVTFFVKASEVGTFTNVSSVEGTPFDWPDDLPAPATDSTTATLDVTSSTIKIEKSVSPSSVPVGEEATWTITVTNISSVAYETVKVIDTLPDGLTYNDNATVGGASQEPDSISGGQLTWNNVAPSGGLQPGDSVTMTFKVLTTEVGTFTNTASVEGMPADCPSDQPAPATDSTTATLDVVSATIDIEKSISTDRTFVGESVICTLSVTNTSSGIYETVKVVDTLPIGLSYDDSATVDGASQEPDSISGSQLTWNNVAPSGGLQPGSSVTVSFKAAATDVGEFTNKASVEGFPFDWPAGQPAPAQDEDEAIVFIDMGVGEDAVALTKEAIPSKVKVGAIVTWKLTITNECESVFTTVALVDTLPEGGVSYNGNAIVNGVPREPDRVEGLVITWDNIAPSGGLNPGASLVVTFETTAVDTGIYTNTAVVSVMPDEWAHDYPSATAKASASVEIEGVCEPINIEINIPDTVCAGETVHLTTSVDGGFPPYSYSWSDDCGGEFSDIHAESPFWTAPTGREHCKIILDILDSEDCPGRKEIEVNIEICDALSITKTAIPTSIHAGEDVQFTINLVNTQDLTVINAKITDIHRLPSKGTISLKEFSVIESGANRHSPVIAPSMSDTTGTYSFGTWDISPGGAITVIMKVNFSGEVPPGFYYDTVTATSDNALPVKDDEVVEVVEDRPSGTWPDSLKANLRLFGFSSLSESSMRFQTDMASFSAKELALCSQSPDLFSSRFSYMPGYLDQVAGRNFDSLYFSSRLGVNLSYSEENPTELLSTYARLTGCSSVPSAESVIFLEYFSGSPLFASPSEESWDERTFESYLTPSSLACALSSQIFQVQRLLSHNRRTLIGVDAESGFKGLITGYQMARKIEFIKTVISGRKEGDEVSYLPERIKPILKRETNEMFFEVLDDSSTLFSQASLLKAASEYRSMSSSRNREHFAETLRTQNLLTPELHHQAEEIALETLNHLIENHYTSSTFIDVFSPHKAAPSTISTSNIFYILDALRTFASSFSDVPEFKERIALYVRRQADFMLLHLVKDNVAFNLYNLDEEKAYANSLLSQAAAIRALFATFELTGDPLFKTRALELLSALEHIYWDRAFEIYTSLPFYSLSDRHSYSPEAIAMLVSAARDALPYTSALADRLSLSLNKLLIEAGLQVPPLSRMEYEKDDFDWFTQKMGEQDRNRFHKVKIYNSQRYGPFGASPVLLTRIDLDRNNYRMPKPFIPRYPKEPAEVFRAEVDYSLLNMDPREYLRAKSGSFSDEALASFNPGSDIISYPSDLLGLAIELDNPAVADAQEVTVELNFTDGVNVLNTLPSSPYDKKGAVRWVLNTIPLGAANRLFTAMFQITPKAKEGDILKLCANVTYVDQNGKLYPGEINCANIYVVRPGIEYKTAPAMFLTSELIKLHGALDRILPKEDVKDFKREIEECVDKNICNMSFRSGIGLPLRYSPMNSGESKKLNLTAQENMDRRIDQFKKATDYLELEPSRTIVPNPVYMEYASGAPYYRGKSEREWLREERREVITPSSVGYTIRARTSRASYLLYDPEGLRLGRTSEDAFKGLMLLYQVLNEIYDLNSIIDSMGFVPHEFSTFIESRKHGEIRYRVIDYDSYLRDHAALISGLSEFLSLPSTMGEESFKRVFDSNDSPFMVEDFDTARELLDKVVGSMIDQFLAVQEKLIFSVRINKGLFVRVETKDLVEAATALERYLSVSENSVLSTRVKGFLEVLGENLNNLNVDGFYSSAWNPKSFTVEKLPASLGTQSAVVCALFSLNRSLGLESYREEAVSLARNVFSEFWDSNLEVFNASLEELSNLIYTAEDVSYTLTALSELIEQSPDAKRPEYAYKLYCFFDQVVSRRGLQLRKPSLQQEIESFEKFRIRR